MLIIVKQPRDVQLLLHEWNSLSVDKDGILQRCTRSRTQILIPKKLRSLILKELHEKMGHLGADRTLHLARERFYWPHMQSDIEHYIGHVCQCVKRKPPTLKIRAPLQPITTTAPFELIAIDFLHLEKSSNKVPQKIHACRIDQEKHSCLGLPHILHKSQEGMEESVLCAKQQLSEYMSYSILV